MKYFIDTNIFIRYFTNDSTQEVFNDCTSLINKLKIGKIKAVTSSLVLAEIVWTLTSSYNANKDQILKVIKAIESILNLKLIERADIKVANKLFLEHSVKYIDALIASNPDIQSKKMTIVSYDKDFDKLGVKRLEPKDFL